MPHGAGAGPLRAAPTRGEREGNGTGVRAQARGATPTRSHASSADPTLDVTIVVPYYNPGRPPALDRRTDGPGARRVGHDLRDHHRLGRLDRRKPVHPRRVPAQRRQAGVARHQLGQGACAAGGARHGSWPLPGLHRCRRRHLARVPRPVRLDHAQRAPGHHHREQAAPRLVGALPAASAPVLVELPASDPPALPPQRQGHPGRDQAGRPPRHRRGAPAVAREPLRPRPRVAGAGAAPRLHAHRGGADPDRGALRQHDLPQGRMAPARRHPRPLRPRFGAPRVRRRHRGISPRAPGRRSGSPPTEAAQTRPEQHGTSGRTLESSPNHHTPV